MKLGAILANRIYKCLLNANGLEGIYEEWIMIALDTWFLRCF